MGSVFRLWRWGLEGMLGGGCRDAGPDAKLETFGRNATRHHAAVANHVTYQRSDKTQWSEEHNGDTNGPFTVSDNHTPQHKPALIAATPDLV